MSMGDIFNPFSEGDEPGYSPYGEPDDGRCCYDKAFTLISNSNAAIATAINAVAISVSERVDEPCKEIEKCIDKIIDALRKRFEGPLQDCETCKAMIANGFGGTFEYAIRCAGVECDKCLEVCSGGDDGKCCKNCGEDKINCKCQAGQCVGEDKPEEKPKAKYIGWCNRLAGTIAVTRHGEPGLAFPWEQVALTETEQAAVDVATKNCEKIEIVVTPSPEQPQSLPPFPTYNCDLNLYSTASGIESFASQLPASLVAGGFAQLVDNLGDLGIGGITLENIGNALAGAMKAIFQIPMNVSNDLSIALSQLLNCPNKNVAPIIQVLANLGLAQKVIGVDLSQYYATYGYALNAVCRQRWLSPDAAMGAYLANAIDYKQLDTQWAIAGLCPQSVQWNLQASKAKPVPLQLAIMRHRELITSADYHRGMRELGYIDPSVSEQLFNVTYQVPTMTDIIRFMVRDADDSDTVARFGLDYGFEQKYRQQLRKWSQDQGVPELAARYSWRSHWQIPSPTQLFEFWRRLRHNDKFGGADKLQEDIKQALIQQDILPYWHEHYLAVSYLPLGRIDLRRAFAIGSIDEQQLRNGLQKLGHSDEDSEILVKFFVRLRRNQIASSIPVKLWKRFSIDRAEAAKRLTDDGIPPEQVQQALTDVEQDFDKSIYAQSFAKGDIDRQTLVDKLTQIGVSQAGAGKIADRVALRVRRHPAVVGYSAGGIDRADADAQMRSFGMDTNVISTLLGNVDADVKWSLLQRCQNGIKHRYLAGELDTGEARALLINNGTTTERAAQLIKEWNCEKSSIGRTIPTSTLCTLLEQGAITAEQFTTRLRNIGHTADDATLLTNNCLSAIADRRSKAIQAEIKKNQQDQRRQQQALARAAAAARREGEAAARAAKQAATTRQRREKQVVDAAEKLYKKCNCDLFTAIGAAKSARQFLIEQGGLDIDTILAILIKAAENMVTGDLADYAKHVEALASQVIESQTDLNANGVGMLELENG